MKKISKILALSFICLMLVACGGKPSDMSENGYEVGEKILDVTSQYLDGELNSSTAMKKIESLRDQIETATDYSKDDELNIISIDIYLAMSDSSEKEVQSLKQNLKDLLGK